MAEFLDLDLLGLLHFGDNLDLLGCAGSRVDPFVPLMLRMGPVIAAHDFSLSFPDPSLHVVLGILGVFDEVICQLLFFLSRVIISVVVANCNNSFLLLGRFDWI